MIGIGKEIVKSISDAIVSLQEDGTLPAFSISEIKLTHPDLLEHGDYTTSVALALAKEAKMKPREVAEAVVSQISNFKSVEVDRVEVAGPGFINFWLSKKWLEKQVAATVKHPTTFAKQKVGKGKKVIVELSSVNIAKEMNIGHFRSNIIGDALANLYETLGYKTIRDNHLGDWGTQFGKLIVAVKRIMRLPAMLRPPATLRVAMRAGKALQAGNGQITRKLDVPTMMELYVQFHKDAEANESLNDAARLETKKLQDGDSENRKLWKTFVELSLAEFQKVYDRLGTKFDTMHGESFYNDMLQGIVDEAKKKGVAVLSEGAIIIPFDNQPPAIIQKSDGAFNYATTDLATIKYRAKTYKPFRVLYCVANEQALHFSQVFSAAKKLEYKHTGDLVHVKFGMALGASGKKFSTRRGETIRLTEVMDEAVRRAKELLKGSDLSEKEKDAVAEAVGVGALKYNDLSQNRVHDIRFDWDRMLSITGNSAPYLQYVAVRIKSILEKAPARSRSPKRTTPWTPDEEVLHRSLYRFPEIIEEAADAYEPHRLAEYLFSLAQQFHRFYDHVPVLKSEAGEMTDRLRLITAVRLTIMEGLRLLGIATPDRM